jgi:hypothetical protein
MELMEFTAALGNIGEFVGSIAVLATLIYLAIQIRHQRQELIVSIGQGRASAVRDLFSMQMEERTSRATVKAQMNLGAPSAPFVTMLMERAGLESEEASLVVQMQICWWNYRLQTVPIVHELSAPDRIQFESAIRQSYGNGGGRRPPPTLAQPGPGEARCLRDSKAACGSPLLSGGRARSRQGPPAMR